MLTYDLVYHQEAYTWPCSTYSLGQVLLHHLHRRCLSSRSRSPVGYT